MQNQRKSRLNPVVGAARRAVADVLNQGFGVGTVAPTGRRVREQAAADRQGRPGAAAPGAAGETPGERPLLLAAVSGGPDSLALASLLAHFNRRGDLRVGAVVVDHQLQKESARVAKTTAQTLRELGLAPVLVKKVTVSAGTEGPEMAARTARYGAFARAAAETGAAAIALGHTLDDQAETVLLGLARGSGTRSLAGMPVDRTENHPAGPVRVIRPLLTLRRSDIEDICADAGLTPWQDPTNTDQALMRARVRHSVLPHLEENLGGGVAVSLARTATIAGADADYLDTEARTALGTVLVGADELGPDTGGLVALLEAAPSKSMVLLNRATLTGLHPALRTRVLALALERVGGIAPGFERLAALDAFVSEHSVAGPLQLPGHISAYRRRPGVTLTSEGQSTNLKKTGLIVLLKTAPSTILNSEQAL
ncbi:tRNA lysidine(34) synthetase TilS [Rothia nasisuis]|uniref:tRNA lysidine(34) synthetase TilS n=1 Tax=Rothia nasisuis TaxID=2109647 RepID=UPI001F00B95F|nr:tRNA lysidine(34) synthetase TilS [Rothia nasisuis]